MNQPEAKKTPEGMKEGLCDDPAVLGVFLMRCREAVICAEKVGRVQEMPARSSPNYPQGVPGGYGFGA